MISFPEKTSAAGGTPLLPEETWRDIPGYEGQYQASSLGRIRGLERYIEQTDRNGRVQKRHVPGRILKPYGSRTGPYMKVTINGKKIRVHKLVTEAFFGPCPKGMEVLHSNGNARDNRISNLKYGTHSENVRETYSYGGKQKTLFGEDTEQIRFGLRSGISCRELAAMYGVHYSTINRIKNHRIFDWYRPAAAGAEAVGA